jgi:hypothetical protein
MSELKKLAEAAKENGEEWYQVRELLDENIDITSDAEFINAASPEAILALIEERDRLKSALSAMLTHMGMDEDEWNKPTFDQARQALGAQ